MGDLPNTHEGMMASRLFGQRWDRNGASQKSLGLPWDRQVTMENLSSIWERVKNFVYTVLVVTLFVLGYLTNPQTDGTQVTGSEQPGGAQEVVETQVATSSVQMIDYNRALASVERDDNYRTTYEVFVSSFRDSNGDGIGDINGVREELDYIADMGFDQLWLTPVHPSATYHKYDVDDYLAIDPSFGTMEDYEALLADCHARGIRVLLDLVLNHTSEEHPWFRAAADYLRKLPPDKEPVFEDCPYVWYYTFSREQLEGFVPLEGTNWYYEARFWSEMPDLNLGSEPVRKEVKKILQFWLDKGVDGFRLDAVTSYVTENTGANVEFLRFLTDTCRAIKPDCYLVGEAWTDRSNIAALYGSGIDSLFDFPFANNGGTIQRVMGNNQSAADYVRDMVASEAEYRAVKSDYVDAPFYTNHDTARSASFYEWDNGPVTKMSYAMSLLMPGDSFVYYGEEIGMPGAGKDENKRAPMYWSSDASAQGMCAAPAGMDGLQMKFPSVEDQLNDDLSLWRWFKEVIHVRKSFPAIARGTTEMADSLCDDSVAAFFRRSVDDQDVLIVMNLRNQPATRDLSSIGNNLSLAAVLNTSEEDVTYEGHTLGLPAYSIAVLTLDGQS